MKRIPVSRTGLWFCAPYLAIIAVCMGFAYLGKFDPKGSFVFLQLPVALQAALLVKLGFAEAFRLLPGWAIYVLLIAPVFVVLYAMGAWVDRLTAPRGHRTAR